MMCLKIKRLSSICYITIKINKVNNADIIMMDIQNMIMVKILFLSAVIELPILMIDTAVNKNCNPG